MKSDLYEQLQDFFSFPVYLYKRLESTGISVTKFESVDNDCKATASYYIYAGQCTCPSFTGKEENTCKHLEMLKGKFFACSGIPVDILDEYIQKFSERYAGEVIQLLNDVETAREVCITLSGDTLVSFDKWVKKGVLAIAGHYKTDHGSVGVLLNLQK